MTIIIGVFAIPVHSSSKDIFDAAKNGDTNFILKYIENGGDINITDVFGRTALMFAAQNGNPDVIKILIGAKANIDAKTPTGQWTALMCAAYCGQKEAAKLLIDAKADVNAISYTDHPPCSTMMIAAMSGHEEIAFLLKKAGAEMDLFTAATMGDIDFVRNFIKEGGDVNILSYPEPGGWMPLSNAAQYGWEEIVKLLIDAKADVNHMDNDGWSPLRKASLNGHTNIVELLKRAGAKDFSVHYGNGDIFSESYFRLKYDFIGSYIKNGGDVNVKNKDGQTAIMMAAFYYADIVKQFINAKADVNAKDNEGWTAAMSASTTGNMDALKLLIDAGADINVKDKYGWTALMRASQNNHPDIVKLLISNNVDINVKNINGQTALMRAAFFGHNAIVEILKQADAE